MIAYLKDGTVSNNKKTRKLINNEKDYFKLRKDVTTDKPWLY